MLSDKAFSSVVGKYSAVCLIQNELSVRFKFVFFGVCVNFFVVYRQCGLRHSDQIYSY